MWSVVHAPRTLSEFVGNKSVVEAALGHDWGKPLLVYGGPGFGKSVFAYALAADLGFEVVGVCEDNMEEAVGLSQTASLWGGRRMLLVDHVESVKDIKLIGELVKQTRSPLVLLTSDLRNKRLATVKKSCVQLGLRKAHPASLAKFLQGVLVKEGVSASASVLEFVAKNAGGDFRAALNDLETLSAGRKMISDGDVGVLSSRDAVADIYNVLSRVYKGEGDSLYDVVSCTWDLSEQPETTLLWIEENMPSIYRDRESVCGAFHSISRADRFLGRIKRRQYWGFLRYVNELMTAGVCVNKPERLSFSKYNFPSYIIAMGRSKKDRALKKSIGGKMGARLHVSARIVAEQYIPLYRRLLKAGGISVEELSGEFDLDEDEMGFISG